MARHLVSDEDNDNNTIDDDPYDGDDSDDDIDHSKDHASCKCL